MPSIQDNTQPLIYKIDKSFSYNFDILQNIKVSNRKSDTWFSDENKLMISMRDWTTRLWNQIFWASWGWRMYFFSDFLDKRHCVRVFNNRVYWLNSSSQWIDLSGNMNGDNFWFNTVKLPLNIWWADSNEHETTEDSTWSELVKKASSDTWGINNIWKVLFITENVWNWNVYRWCFWFINWYDADTNEYILWDSWILWTVNPSTDDIIWIKSWSKYKIFDTIWEFLQMSNWVSLEKYFYWKVDWTLGEFVDYRWLATYWLRNVKALRDNQFLFKQIYWNNSYYTWNKWTLFYSSWNVNNPFFYTFTNAISIPSLNWWTIQDIFIFKNRLIIWGSNFINYINRFTNLVEIESIAWSFWMKFNSLCDLWTDSYFISSNRQIYSIQETISWTLIATNIWKIVNNYIKDFNTNICSWFDWRKLFFYWQLNSNTPGIMIVLDIEYKFWSIYTGLTPACIVNENWVIYMTDINTDLVSFFDSSTTKDNWNDIEQKIVFNEFTGFSAFNWKTIADFLIWMDNFSQEFYVDIFMANPIWNWRKPRKIISIQEVDINSENLPMWEWNMWEWILGWNWYEKDISFPFMKRISFDSDIANIWKIIITWKDWSPFYLNEAMVDFKPDETKTYFSPENTI